MRPSVTEPEVPGAPAATAGRLRRRLAVALGRDEAAADQVSRRIVHGAGAFILVYYPMPVYFFVILPKEAVLLLALAAVGGIEVLRLGFGTKVPTIREYEARRPASYVFYAVALVIAVLLFPVPIAGAVVLGTAIVDPLAGELRAQPRWARLQVVVPFAVYTALAAVALGLLGPWPWGWSVALGALAGAVGVSVERWRFRWVDDDLSMTVVPALVLYAVGIGLLGLPR